MLLSDEKRKDKYAQQLERDIGRTKANREQDEEKKKELRPESTTIIHCLNRNNWTGEKNVTKLIDGQR